MPIISQNAGTTNIFGGSSFSFGPGFLYFDTASGGENLNLGKTENIVMTFNTTRLGLRSSQDGDTDADRAISGQEMLMTANLAQPTLERLELIWPGFEVEKDSNGNITGYGWTNVLNRRDVENAVQATFFEIVEGLEANPATQQFRIIDIYCVAPQQESAEVTYDATTQRFFPLDFKCYPSANLSASGRNLFFKSRTK